ncbi:amylo-alpha-1,6-glucosidase [Azorhizobium oxalatiphilum]|uniref:Amylo-alpha-1,6-glucosidase n=1 Tax=Azorhizobium oxalatiphilum TaxID=980631 RepID=A0A917F945_9HYPH|nr:amylo-alpha-1,6-glucosidase [Azorhizobium oxalatiphilum]GGF54736.1 amylo-alpha-1,6-glucosidase [Azorhizobium oxalatiphilum]
MNLQQQPDGTEEPLFEISSYGPPSRPRGTLKQGDAFAVFDLYGDMGVSPGTPDGLYHQDTRHLSHWSLKIEGREPLFLGSTILDGNAGLAVDLTNPDVMVDGRNQLPKDTLHVVRLFFLWQEAAHERCSIQNYGSEPVDVVFTYEFDNDFIDLFEARGARRANRGTLKEPVIADGRVQLGYRGLDGVECHTEIEFRPKPTHLRARSAEFVLQLAPGERTSLFATIATRANPERMKRPFLQSFQRACRSARTIRAGMAEVVTSSSHVNDVLERSAADLGMLLTQTPQGLYPYAGIPWYSTTFGRDGLLTALSMLWADPAIAKGVLLRLAALQAKSIDPEADAEPGKILHEMRGGEMARLKEVPFALYYGSVDSTPLFVLLAGRYFERTGDVATLRTLWPAILAALGWINGPGDRDKDGFLEYYRATDTGLANQGWKDSFDSIFHADGRLAEGPIALVEVQAYVHAAKLSVAVAAQALGETELSARLRFEAATLAERFEQHFWCGDIGTYAVALDGQKRPCKVATSNPGHALFSGIVQPDRAASVIGRLMDKDGASGWGIRTMARGEARYNPMSYHNGSIWPHDNAVAALGMAQYGHTDAAVSVLEAMLDAGCSMSLGRLPELYCGFRRRKGRGPTLYPVACAPQAWASATVFACVQACLGIDFRAEAEEVIFRRPRLPRNIDELTIRNLRVGRTELDVTVQRRGADVSVGVDRRIGDGQAIVLL